nr:MAG TPA: hypothetical protein [Caudoviricetes sp.]
MNFKEYSTIIIIHFFTTMKTTLSIEKKKIE